MKGPGAGIHSSVMNENPLATVAMVTYNSAKYVATAIESVLCQSYENLELVVCDDCSTDDTWAIVRSYADPRLRAYRNEKNLGEYANRNHALGLARGRYVIYIDGDDILYPHGLEFMVRMLEAFPASAMAISLPRSERFVYPVEMSPREVYLCQFLGEEKVHGSGLVRFLFRTEVLREVGGFDTRYRSGDPYIQQRISLSHHSLFINDGLAWWRRRAGQASEVVNRDHISYLEGLEFNREFLSSPECPLTPDEVELALSNLYGGFIRIALRCVLQRRVGQAIRLLRKARIPLRAWRYALVPSRYPYLSDVTAERPLTCGLHRSPFAKAQRAEELNWSPHGAPASQPVIHHQIHHVE